jgi:uncharacterized protein
MEGFEYNVSTLLRQDVGAESRHEVRVNDPLDLDLAVATPITGALRLTRTNFGVLARAKLKGQLLLECDRCLASYPDVVDVDFTEEYLPVVDVATGRPVQSKRSDETFSVSANHIVDLTEAARQHFLLAIPMHRVCREDCSGLCQTCGVNLNMTKCRCAQDAENPLSVLATLLAESEIKS